jgi:hypothetical protein
MGVQQPLGWRVQSPNALMQMRENSTVAAAVHWLIPSSAEPILIITLSHQASLNRILKLVLYNSIIIVPQWFVCHHSNRNQATEQTEVPLLSIIEFEPFHRSKVVATMEETAPPPQIRCPSPPSPALCRCGPTQRRAHRGSGPTVPPWGPPLWAQTPAESTAIRRWRIVRDFIFLLNLGDYGIG